jgi:hypothetical protein
MHFPLIKNVSDSGPGKVNLFLVTLTILITFLIPAKGISQDLTQSEIEEYTAIRDSLIEVGILNKPAGQLTIDATAEEPLLDFANYTGKSFEVVTENSRASDFNPDGTRFYILGRNTENIVEYQLSTPWDIETAEYVRELDISDEMGSEWYPESAANGVYIRKDDGKKLWVLNRREIWEYTLSTPWNITSAVPTGYKNLSDFLVRGHDFDFKPDGSVIYIDDRVVEAVFQIELDDDWDIETGELDYAFDISDQQIGVRGTQFNHLGNRMYLMDTGRQAVLEYSLSNPYDLRSAEFIGFFDVSDQAESPRGVTFRPDFSTFYVTEAFESVIYQYSLAEPDELKSKLISSSSRVVANGIASSRIEVTIRNQVGGLMKGVNVQLNSNNGNVNIQAVNEETNSEGLAVFNVSSTVTGTVNFAATAMGVIIDEIVTVRFAGVDSEESSVVSNINKIVANGEAEAIITVTARDEEGEGVEGVPIDLDANRNNVSIRAKSETTDRNGELIFEVSSISEQDVTFRATGFGVEIEQTATLRFVGVDADESSIIVDNEKILANGSAFAKVTVIARDEDGDELRDVRIQINTTSSNVRVETINEITNSDGEAIFEISSSIAESITLNAEGLNTEINDDVLIRFVTVDPVTSEIIVINRFVVADGQEQSRIQVITRDEDGDVLEGARVNLIPLNGDSKIDNNNQTSNENGFVDFLVSNQNPENVDFEVEAENIRIPPTVRIGFTPLAPVALTATDVETRQFVANWEVVNGAETYVLDVSENEDFTSILPSYSSNNVGNVTSFSVTNISPGTTYYYRLRAQKEDLIGESSQTIETTTFPEVPIVSEASNRNALAFTANWQQAEGARNYRLDVARDRSFEEMVSGFDDLNVGAVTSYEVTGLLPGERYHYRVRSEAGSRLSDYSQVGETTTLTISSEQSEINTEQLRVMANGTQKNNLSVIVKSDEGVLLEGLTIELEQTEGKSEIEAVEPVTNEEGVAIFAVSSRNPGKSTYLASVVGIEVGEISVEFLQDDGILELGNNYPNPFRSETIIPVTVPRSMQVTITVYNSLGAPVRTAIDEQLEPGYYEIPFRARDLASGIYFYRLMTEEGLKTEKMVLVK